MGVNGAPDTKSEWLLKMCRIRVVGTEETKVVPHGELKVHNGEGNET